MGSNSVPGVDDVKNQTTSNAKAGAAAAAGVAGGSLLLGDVLGPAAGGVAAGAFIGGDTGTNITVTGAMLAGNNLANGGQ